MNTDVDEGRSLWSRLRGPAFGLAAIAVVVGWVVFNPLSFFEDEPEEVAAVRESAELRLADLSASFAGDGSLVFGDFVTVVHSGAGTITRLAEPGLRIEMATVLYAVDNMPTVVLPGSVPAWRTMNVDAVGDDVLQLEAALVEMGYDSLDLLTVDDTYTTYTADLVELWQTDLGMEATGAVEFGTVIFLDGVNEVGTVFGEVGQAPPAAGVLSVRSVERVVTFTVQEWPELEVGSVVVGEFSDRTEADVEVVQIEADGAGTWTITGELDPANLPASGAEEVPMSFSWSVGIGDGLLVAPASSIKRLDSQTYVVEVVLDGLETAFVPVELGRQSGSLVEIRGDVAEGTLVISP